MPVSKRRLFVAVLALLAVLYIILAGPPQGKRLFKESRTSMYTLVSITVLASSPEKAGTAMDAAYQELERLGRLLNFYAADSELTTINKNAGIQPVRVSPDTLEIIEAAIYAGERTEGGFDVTVGPLVKLWDFNTNTIPSATSIAESLPLVGYKNIVVDSAASTVFLNKPGVQIDLGGIIKGFAADKAVEILINHGIDDGIVAVAGDIKVFGRQLDGRPWHVGIQNPRQENDDTQLLATVDLEGVGISTSGDYQRYFIQDGIRYHHLLNPRTGYPESLCRSVTVIAPDATLTDAFATGIFVMGPGKGLGVLEKLGMEGVIVDRQGEILMTRGIRDRVHLVQTAGEKPEE